MERITDTHVFFWSSEFSNWYECKFIYKDIVFYNSEQAFMWEKAMFFDDKYHARLITETPSPASCKKIGRKIKGFDPERWLIAAFPIMVAINYAKYNQNSNLKKILLLTGNKTMVEASPYDKIWGIGIHWDDDDCLDETKWKGMNLLGKALMEVRKQLS